VKRRLAVKPGSNTFAYEPILPLCEGRYADGQGQHPHHTGFEAAHLRLCVKISRVMRDFHALFTGLTPKTKE
jgi:hypothetical protein